MLANLKDLWQRRALIFVWTRYNLQSRYIETKLGLLWIVLQPLAMTLIYAFAFGVILGVRPPRGGVPFICFLISGVTIWSFFSTCITSSHSSIVSNLGLMSQVRFPREAVVLVRFSEALVDFAVTMVLMIGITAIYGHLPSAAYWAMPFVLLGFMLFSIGLMFFLGSLSVYVRDIPEMISIGLRFLFYLSGVIFALESLPDALQKYVYLNPLAVMIQSFRDVVLYAVPPSWKVLLYILVVGILVFIVGYAFFKAREREFADYI